MTNPSLTLGRSRRAGLTGISNTTMERVAKDAARVLYVAGKTQLLLAALWVYFYNVEKYNIYAWIWQWDRSGFLKCGWITGGTRTRKQSLQRNRISISLCIRLAFRVRHVCLKLDFSRGKSLWDLSLGKSRFIGFVFPLSLVWLAWIIYMYLYSSPYFHGQSESRKYSNARLIYFIYWFITVNIVPMTSKWDHEMI